MKILDVTGKKCPLPLIETKKALKEMEKDEVLKVITDNEAAKNNVTRFLNDNNIESEWIRNDKFFEVMINYQNADLEKAQAEAYCTPAETTNKGFVVVFTKNYIGEGSEELGRILMNGFLDTLIADDNIPKKMMLFNSGVLMAIRGSEQEEVLKELEEAGAEILVCGTCLNFYKKASEITVGKESNMLEIQIGMMDAGNVLNF